MAERQVKSREAKVDLDEDVLEVIVQGPAPGPGPSDETLDYDDDTLKAIAEVYQEDGDKEFTRKEVCNAIYFYTEGIHVNCPTERQALRQQGNSLLPSRKLPRSPE